ncbi:hypothetical protein [Niabella beijingensis]|uniref:hypothetical protein n=1 Tax=Niabella beijingensis TaxID=2872700 RepID=UPI001CBEEC51|nr:hypothetical protein [Niabella beijingensis]MBZ4191098.1 hypothetical protein [Niabella beijingensis]
MKLVAVVITYFPGKEFLSNISSYLNYVDRLYIVDNSEPSFSFDSEIVKDSRITLIADGVNRGIATRLNQVLDIVVNEGFEWLLTMDQDSCFDEDQFQQYISNILNFKQRETVAMFGIETGKTPQTPSTEFERSRLLITSGSMINLGLVKSIGGFDERLFIDDVDHEYCFRAGRQGFESIRFTAIYLNHNLGTTHSVRSLKNMRQTNRALHPPFRLYYMYRNFLYISKIYKKDFPREVAFLKKDLYNRLKNNFLYGSQKLKVLNAVLRARKDFLSDRMGKQPITSLQ